MARLRVGYFLQLRIVEGFDLANTSPKRKRVKLEARKFTRLLGFCIGSDKSFSEKYLGRSIVSGKALAAGWLSHLEMQRTRG